MTALLNWLAQIVSVTRFSLQTLTERRGAAASAVFGIAGVVLVFVAVLSIARGFAAAMASNTTDDTAIVLRGGATSEMMSGLSREDTRIIAEAAGVARDDSGPIASSELFVVINLLKATTLTDANVPLRGVERRAFSVRPEFEIVDGRDFEWGRNEVVVGIGAAREFAGLEVGRSIPVASEQWEIVGHFRAGGGLAESEIWTDASVLQPAYRRGDSFQTVQARLESTEAFNRFKDALTTDPRLDVKVARQSEFYSSQSGVITGIIQGLGGIIAALMGLGALFGALNTMYSAVSTRTREIATLRALGFGSGPVVISVLVESLVLAIVGGAIGAGLAYLLFDGFRTSTINWASFSQVAFAFRVTPDLLLQGIFYASLLGLIGGFFPAIRAARMPVANALREL